MTSRYLQKFLIVTKSKSETDFTYEENQANNENYERDKEGLINFTHQESFNDNINKNFGPPLLENKMLNNNLLELKAEESEEININTIYFMDKPKENKKKIFMAIKEKIKPQNGNKRGRKRKGESGKGKHSKKEKDNIIRKIKVHFFRYVKETLNKAIKDKRHKFKNVPYYIISKSSKEFNTDLMNLTIKEIYEESFQYVDKYTLKKFWFLMFIFLFIIFFEFIRGFRAFYNKEKNYKRNKWALEYFSKEENEVNEKEVINLLNLNFIQFFDIFRNEYLPTFLDEINPLSKNKKPNNNKKGESNVDEKIDEEDVNQYLTKVENICNNFETLFLNKTNSSKKIKTKKNEKTEKSIININK